MARDVLAAFGAYWLARRALGIAIIAGIIVLCCGCQVVLGTLGLLIPNTTGSSPSNQTTVSMTTPVTVDSFQYSVTNAQRTKEPNQQWVAVFLTARNSGQRTASLPRSGFWLVDSNNRRYSSRSVTSSPFPKLADLNKNNQPVAPGDVRDIGFAYQVPESATGLRLVVSNSTVAIDLSQAIG